MFYQAPLAVCVFTVRYVHVWKSQEGSRHVYRVLMSWVIDLGPHKVGDHLTRNKLLSFYRSREYCGFMLNTQICSRTCTLLTNQRAAFLLSGREEKGLRLLIILVIIVHKEGNSHEVRVQVFTIFSV